VLGGHPHDIDLRITKCLIAEGHDVHVYAHQKADKQLLLDYESIAPISTLFSIDPYLSPMQFDYIAGDIIKNLEGARVTANELLQMRQADVWLWPSIYQHQLLACTFINTNVLISGCIHHPPEFFSAGDIAWWRYALLQSEHKNINLNLCTIEAETRYLYLHLSKKTNISLFPFPNDGKTPEQPRKNLKKIGIFGFQRAEKGSLLLQTLLEKLASTNLYDIVLHDSSQQNNTLNNINNVTYLGHVADLESEIASCDLVVAPYNIEAYRHRGSGIVNSAIANGVPVIAPLGSAPGRIIETSGAGVLFAHYSIDSIYNAIQLAKKNYPTIAQAAYAASLDWSEKHGIKKFTQAMLTPPTQLKDNVT
jgi:glycosyltransferase involved in cell wall biosynthesis